MQQQEVQVRKHVLKEYNKTREDFASLREWRDYQEEVETIIEKLLAGIDVRETKEQMRVYAERNHDATALNASKRAEAANAARERIAREERAREAIAARMREEEEAARAEQRREKAAMEKQLASDKPQAALHPKRARKEPKQEKPAVAVAVPSGPPPVAMQPAIKQYRPMTSLAFGGALPSEPARLATRIPQAVALASGMNQGERKPMSREAERAAGYDRQTVLARDLSEAFANLWI
jgi:CDK-activating kinase assembly factor MAT1